MSYVKSIEGVFVAGVPAGGSGRVSGLIRFTPPPYSVFYDGVKLEPLVVWTNELGKLCAKRDSATMPGKTVPIAGRR